MATLDSLHSPLAFLGNLIADQDQLAPLKDYESWWLTEGRQISETVDRAGTPWLRMFDQFGKRTDEILFPSEYWKMLKRGYQAGVIWRPFADNSPRMHYLIDYVTCFFDAGLGCPYIVSMSTAVPLKKYGSPELQAHYLPHLLRRDESVWQGATWMTEAKGGSDLGATVETTARRAESRSIAGGPNDDKWILNGDKYFASNVGAELAIVAARPEGSTGVPPVNHAQDARATTPPGGTGVPPVNHAQDARATTPPGSTGVSPVNHAQDARATTPPGGTGVPPVNHAQDARATTPPGSTGVPPVNHAQDARATTPPGGTGVPPVNHAQDARATTPPGSTGVSPVNHAQDARATTPPGGTGVPPVNHAQDARATTPPGSTGVPPVNHAQDARATTPPGSTGVPPVNHAQDARATTPPGSTGVPPVNHAQDARATTPHGLALFLVPRYRDDGELNYFIRRIKNKIGTRSVPTGEVELRDSEAYLLGKQEWGIYLILESLNLSRVGNICGSVALAQRALADALTFAQGRVAFSKPIIQHPLLRRQFEERFEQLQDARALMWEAMQLLEEVWQETPRYSDRYHLFRLVAHLAKYWTAELAVQFAKWNMEVHGGMGVLAEYSAERWLREAMILPIWEGTPHRQMLDGLEVMERKRAHEMLFDHLAPHASPSDLGSLRTRIDEHLQLPPDEKEAGIEPIFRGLATFTAQTLGRKYK